MDNLLITKFGSFNISISCYQCCFEECINHVAIHLGISLKSQKTNNPASFTQIFLMKNKHEIRMSLPLVIRTFCQISSRYKPNRDVLKCKRFESMWCNA